MILHLLEGGTLLITAIIAGGVCDWLYRTGTRPWTWQRPLRIPELVDEPYYPDDASVGNV